MKIFKYLLITFVALAAIGTVGNMAADSPVVKGGGVRTPVVTTAALTVGEDDFEFSDVGVDADWLVDEVYTNAEIAETCDLFGEVVDLYGYNFAYNAGLEIFIEEIDETGGISGSDIYEALIARC